MCDLKFWTAECEETFHYWLGKGKATERKAEQIILALPYILGKSGEARWLGQRDSLRKFVEMWASIYLHFVGLVQRSEAPGPMQPARIPAPTSGPGAQARACWHRASKAPRAWVHWKSNWITYSRIHCC